MSITLAANTIVDSLNGQTVPLVGWEISSDMAYVLAGLVHFLVLFHVFALCPFFFIWLERKLPATAQPA